MLAVVGDEELLVERAIRDAVATVTAGDPDADVHELVGAAADRGTLAELTAPSLFGGRNVIVLRGAQDLKKEPMAEVIGYLSQPPADLTLVLVHAGGAKGKTLLDAARTSGVPTVTCQKVTRPSARVDFVRAEIRRAASTITEDAIRSLLDAVGNDLREIASACSQLAADTTGRIDEDTVARYHKGRAEVTGFTVADRAIEGRLGDATEQLRWALAIGVSPVLVISALAQGLRSIAKVGAAGSRGIRGPALAKELAMPPWKVDRVRGQLRGWTPAGVADALRAVAAADAEVKGGAADPAFALEHVVRRVIAARAG